MKDIGETQKKGEHIELGMAREGGNLKSNFTN